MDSKSTSSIGIVGLLGVAFIILKLIGDIDWSWWWVLAPFWVPVALFLLLLILAYFIAWRDK